MVLPDCKLYQSTHRRFDCIHHDHGAGALPCMIVVSWSGKPETSGSPHGRCTSPRNSRPKRQEWVVPPKHHTWKRIHGPFPFFGNMFVSHETLCENQGLQCQGLCAILSDEHVVASLLFLIRLLPCRLSDGSLPCFSFFGRDVNSRAPMPVVMVFYWHFY